MELEENTPKNMFRRKCFKEICGKIGAEKQIDQELSEEKDCR